jgi:uncharacterized protein (TIGR03437 family)
MVRAAILLLSAACLPAFAGSVTLFTSLPNAAVSKAIQLDAAGNIYLAGTIPSPSLHDPSDAFVAKLSADGSKVLYFTTISGSSGDNAAGIALGSDGSAYVVGSTGSSDFPVTPGAFQTTFNLQGASQGFLVKVNPSGTAVYASYIGGSVFTQATGIALDKMGAAYITGTGGPAYPPGSNQPIQGFVLKLDPSLTVQQLSVYGYGGGQIVLDSQNDIYLAGVAAPSGSAPPFMLPALPAGAFQTTHNANFCYQSSGPGGAFAQFCQYQLVAKLDPVGKLLWATYVTGTWGAIPAGMAVDATGNVIVAGTTNSSDYPVTVDAFQTAYNAAGPHAPNNTGNTGPPNATGYVTKVAAGGTALLWSTYFGGSSQDQITGMAVSPSSEIFLSGRAASSDLFFADTPDGCLPSANQVLGFVARLTPDGASIAATVPIQGAPDCLYVNCIDLSSYALGWPIALRPSGAAVVAGSNGTVASVDFSTSPRVACLTDPADNAQLASVAPGQLLSVFGADIAPAAPFIPPGGLAPSTSSFGVFFNGIPAPILYSSGQQINVQVPFEIAGATSVQMQLVSQKITNPVSETRTLAMVQRQPSIYLSPAALLSQIAGYSSCGGQTVFGQTAVALNEDGILNDCTHPATAGRPVTIFLNGFGPMTPALSTGTIASAPPVSLTPSLDPGPFTGTLVLATTTNPGSITGLARVQAQDGGQSTLFNGASLAGVPTRERVILIWIR